MNKKFNIGILIFVNLVILVTILAAIECGYRVFGSDRVEYGVVITSYSIHYTKLYDNAFAFYVSAPSWLMTSTMAS